MKGLIQLGVGLAGWLVAPVALAEPAFELGGRLGYGHPFGESGEGGDLDESVAGQIPIWLDLGLRVDPMVSIGAFGSLGWGLLTDEARQVCDNTADDPGITDCSTHIWDLRLGAGVAFHFPSKPEAPSPWLGVGMGYEWLSFDFNLEGVENGENVEAELTGTLRGLEFANLHAGIDFPVSPRTWVGPFVTYTVGRYDTLKLTCDGECGDLESQSQEIDDDEKAFHHWLFLGVRLTALP
jgi:hypothetical protein